MLVFAGKFIVRSPSLDRQSRFLQRLSLRRSARFEMANGTDPELSSAFPSRRLRDASGAARHDVGYDKSSLKKQGSSSSMKNHLRLWSK